MLNFINPTDIILRTPLVSVGIIARLKNIRTLPCFADTIKSTGVRTTVLRQLWRLAFNGRHVQIISNHHITACKNLADIGFPSEKIVPWDWPNRVHPAQRSPKRLTMKKDDAHSLIYVGAVSRAKGVHDLLDALPHVAEAGLNVRLSIIGQVTKEVEADLQQYIRSIGIEKQVLIIGAVANAEIITRMHLADLVIIPSRHEYPEGMPITI